MSSAALLLRLLPLLAALALPAAADPPADPPREAKPEAGQQSRWPDLQPSKRLFAIDERTAFDVQRRPVGRFPVAVERVSFPSPFTSPLERNNTAYGLLHAPRRLTDRAVILLPIWKGGDLALERSIASSLALLGYKVLVMPAAYQFDRAKPGVRSGAWTMSSDLVRTRNAMIQTVQDARRAASWLRAHEGIKHLAIMGVSLGGILSSVVYGVDDRFDAGVFLLAGGDLGGLLYVSTETRRMRVEARQQGITADEARHALRAVEPLTYADKRRSAGVFMFNGSRDQSMPRAHVDKLAQAWGTQPTWVPRGHYDIWPYLPRMLRKTADHLKARLRQRQPADAPGDREPAHDGTENVR